MLTQVDDNVVLGLEKCLKCNNIIEMFKSPIKNVYNIDSLLYEILHNPDLKVEFESFTLMCPLHKEDTEGSTYHRMEKEELEILNKTPLNKIFVTVTY